MEKYKEIPSSLRRWFLVHFIMDILFAIPLMFFPQSFLFFFGWANYDPFFSRLVAAALFGIGIESLLGRNGDRASFITMLNLKIIWSISAIIGLVIGIVSLSFVVPLFFYAVLVIFLVFNMIWIYYRIRLK